MPVIAPPERKYAFWNLVIALPTFYKYSTTMPVNEQYSFNLYLVVHSYRIEVFVELLGYILTKKVFHVF